MSANMNLESSDESYKTKNQEPIPVQDDDAPVEDQIDSATADSDQQLEKDEKDAIDTSNIIDDKTRGAKPTGTYKEPSDDVGV